MAEIQVRRFRAEDIDAVCSIFFDAVHRGAAAYYDERQRQAWAPSVPDSAEWLGHLAEQTVFVAEQEGEVLGFMTLRPDGYLDLAFVAADRIGTGIAKRLYDSIEAEAHRLGLRRIHAEASHLARRFFERQDWSVVTEQSVERHGVELTNFVMEKHLA